MKLIHIIIPCLCACAVFATSCTNSPNARQGTAIGAIGGATAGGIIGNQSGRALEGALIGGALGGVGGNVIGGNQDERNRRR
jgi:uncharacterized protein YcfJ